MNTPELNKLSKVKEDSQKIGEFLEWLQGTKNYRICQHFDTQDLYGYYPITHGSHGLTEELLAEYFGIDLKKTDAEKEGIYQEVKAKAKTK